MISRSTYFMKTFGSALFVVCGLMIGALTARPANAAMLGLVQFSLLGGINETLNNGGGVGYTAGAEANFWLGPTLGLSVGGQYLSRNFSPSNLNWIQVPVVLRFSILPMLSVGGGYFHDFPVTTGVGANDGIVVSARVAPPLFPLFVEGRYDYGLNTSSFSSNTSELQALVGFQF
jgi:hypothetical protein